MNGVKFYQKLHCKGGDILSFFWKNDFEFKELDMYEFSYFEDVVVQNELDTAVDESLSMFMITNVSRTILSKYLYQYCYHKQVNLIHEKRWKANFLGDVSLYLTEKGRYLQAFFRDVNNNIDKKGTNHTKTTGENISGTSGTSKGGTVSSSQSGSVGGNNTLSGTEELGDTLTILDNQTTSTKYLASKNDESYSKGSQTEETNTNFTKTLVNDSTITMNNDDRLTDEKNKSDVDTDGTYSPLEIAKLETEFNFLPWLDDLLKRIDEHFLVGGLNYA